MIINFFKNFKNDQELGLEKSIIEQHNKPTTTYNSMGLKGEK